MPKYGETIENDAAIFIAEEAFTEGFMKAAFLLNPEAEREMSWLKSQAAAAWDNFVPSETAKDLTH